MNHPARAIVLSLALILGTSVVPARAQEEGDPNAAAAPDSGGGSAFMGYGAAGAFVCLSIFALCKTARRT